MAKIDDGWAGRLTLNLRWVQDKAGQGSRGGTLVRSFKTTGSNGKVVALVSRSAAKAEGENGIQVLRSILILMEDCTCEQVK